MQLAMKIGIELEGFGLGFEWTRTEGARLQLGPICIWWRKCVV